MRPNPMQSGIRILIELLLQVLKTYDLSDIKVLSILYEIVY
jgi:hypothetical protein